MAQKNLFNFFQKQSQMSRSENNGNCTIQGAPQLSSPCVSSAESAVESQKIRKRFFC